MSIQKPIILREGNYTYSEVESLKKSHPILEVSDVFLFQLKELFEVRNPETIFSKDFEEKQQDFINAKKAASNELGDWIYYPWNHKLVHVVSEPDYYELRTNRNRNIITTEEQEKLRKFTVAIAGMSVGSNIANNLAYTGIAHSLKLSDFDTLETTNLNRVRARIDQIGSAKLQIISEQLYEINPYVDLHLFEKGLDEVALDSFINTDPKPGLIFEIIDDLKMKIKLRLKAREARIPVVMLTSIGDSILIDIERYDLEPNLQIFNGKIGDVGEEILSKEITKAEEQKYVISIVGKENLPKRVMESVKKIGAELVGRPQLMTTITVESGLAAYITRQIALGEKVESGRKLFKFSDII